MFGAIKRDFVGRQGEQVAACVRRAVVQLAVARDYAQDVQVEPWQFAVEIDSLLAVEVTASDLSWLVQGGYVECARR